MRLCINKKCSLCSPLFGNFSIAKCCSVVNCFLLFFIAFYCLELVLYELCIYFVQILLFQGKMSKKYRMQLGASTVSDFLFSSLMCWMCWKVLQEGRIWTTFNILNSKFSRCTFPILLFGISLHTLKMSIAHNYNLA